MNLMIYSVLINPIAVVSDPINDRDLVNSIVSFVLFKISFCYTIVVDLSNVYLWFFL